MWRAIGFWPVLNLEMEWIFSLQMRYSAVKK
jgi:hypothetical protein